MTLEKTKPHAASRDSTVPSRGTENAIPVPSRGTTRPLSRDSRAPFQGHSSPLSRDILIYQVLRPMVSTFAKSLPKASSLQSWKVRGKANGLYGGVYG